MSGAEIIGLAASVVQLADVGLKLSVNLYTYTRKVKSADKSIEVLSNEIATTGAILRQLGAQFDDEHTRQLCKPQAIATAKGLVSDCEKVFAKLQKLADPLEPAKKSKVSILQRVKFTFLEPHIEELKANLDRLKSSLLVILNLLILAEQVRNKETPQILGEQKQLLQSLVAETAVNEQRYHTIVKLIKHSEHSDAASDNTLVAQPFESLLAKTESLPEPILLESNLPEGLKHHHGRIVDHGRLVTNLLGQISSQEYRLDHAHRMGLHNGILDIHWGAWSHMRKAHGYHVFLKLFGDFEDVSRHWSDKLLSDSQSESEGANKIRFSQDSIRVGSSKRNSFDALSRAIHSPPLNQGGQRDQAQQNSNDSRNTRSSRSIHDPKQLLVAQPVNEGPTEPTQVETYQSIKPSLTNSDFQDDIVESPSLLKPSSTRRSKHSNMKGKERAKDNAQSITPSESSLSLVTERSKTDKVALSGHASTILTQQDKVLPANLNHQLAQPLLTSLERASGEYFPEKVNETYRTMSDNNDGDGNSSQPNPSLLASPLKDRIDVDPAAHRITGVAGIGHYQPPDFSDDYPQFPPASSSTLVPRSLSMTTYPLTHPSRRRAVPSAISNLHEQDTPDGGRMRDIEIRPAIDVGIEWRSRSAERRRQYNEDERKMEGGTGTGTTASRGSYDDLESGLTGSLGDMEVNTSNSGDQRLTSTPQSAQQEKKRGSPTHVTSNSDKTGNDVIVEPAQAETHGEMREKLGKEQSDILELRDLPSRQKTTATGGVADLILEKDELDLDLGEDVHETPTSQVNLVEKSICGHQPDAKLTQGVPRSISLASHSTTLPKTRSKVNDDKASSTPRVHISNYSRGDSPPWDETRSRNIETSSKPRGREQRARSDERTMPPKRTIYEYDNPSESDEANKKPRYKRDDNHTPRFKTLSKSVATPRPESVMSSAAQSSRTAAAALSDAKYDFTLTDELAVRMTHRIVDVAGLWDLAPADVTMWSGSRDSIVPRSDVSNVEEPEHSAGFAGHQRGDRDDMADFKQGRDDEIKRLQDEALKDDKLDQWLLEDRRSSYGGSDNGPDFADWDESREADDDGTSRVHVLNATTLKPSSPGKDGDDVSEESYREQERDRTDHVEFDIKRLQDEAQKDQKLEAQLQSLGEFGEDIGQLLLQFSTLSPAEVRNIA